MTPALPKSSPENEAFRAAALCGGCISSRDDPHGQRCERLLQGQAGCEGICAKQDRTGLCTVRELIGTMQDFNTSRTEMIVPARGREWLVEVKVDDRGPLPYTPAGGWDDRSGANKENVAGKSVMPEGPTIFQTLIDRIEALERKVAYLEARVVVLQSVPPMMPIGPSPGVPTPYWPAPIVTLTGADAGWKPDSQMLEAARKADEKWDALRKSPTFAELVDAAQVSLPGKRWTESV